MTPILLTACRRCGGALIPDDDGDHACLLCGRPRVSPAPLPLVKGHGEAGFRGKYPGERKRPTKHEQRLAEGRRPHRRRS